MSLTFILVVFLSGTGVGRAGTQPAFEPAPIESSWADLTTRVHDSKAWLAQKSERRRQFLELIRDDQKPAKPPPGLQVHESVVVDGVYTRKLISYNVEAGERCHAYLAIPLSPRAEPSDFPASRAVLHPGSTRPEDGPARKERPIRGLPAIVALHPTYAHGKEQTAGIEGNPDKAYLDHLARRGYVVIAPDHFVSGHRTPPEGPYDTRRFYDTHPDWTAVGKTVYEGSIAIDVLQSLPEVDPERIGVLGHSLGGHGSFFLAAYDPRIKATAANCSGPTFRHNPKVLEWARDRWYVYFKHLRPGLLRGELPPIDMHSIIALIAPRPFLDVSALNDGDPLTQRQRVLMDLAIAEVYRLEGVPQNFAFYVHGRGHSLGYESRHLVYAWLDAQLKPPAELTPHLVGQ